MRAFFRSNLNKIGLHGWVFHFIEPLLIQHGNIPFVLVFGDYIADQGGADTYFSHRFEIVGELLLGNIIQLFNLVVLI